MLTFYWIWQAKYFNQVTRTSQVTRIWTPDLSLVVKRLTWPLCQVVLKCFCSWFVHGYNGLQWLSRSWHWHFLYRVPSISRKQNSLTFPWFFNDEVSKFHDNYYVNLQIFTLIALCTYRAHQPLLPVFLDTHSVLTGQSKFPDFSLIWGIFLKFPDFSLTGKM